jgi:acyl-CoA thioester hydrolase
MMRLVEAPVTAGEIDHLGHMNVRFFSKRARMGAFALLARTGWDRAALQSHGLMVSLQDSFNHFFKEQREGAPLVVQGGFVDPGVAPRVYLEIVNDETGDRAAAFIVRLQLLRVATRTAAADVTPARSLFVELPDHAAPRSLSLDPPRLDVRLSELDRLSAGWPQPYGPSEGRVSPGVCDEAGFMKMFSAQDISFVAIEAASRDRGHLQDGGGNLRFGWAVLESRQVLVATPRAGDRIRSISAQMRVERKVRQDRRWAFNADTGQLLAITDSVALAFDPALRRSIEIPEGARRELEAQRLPRYA